MTKNPFFCLYGSLNEGGFVTEEPTACGGAKRGSAGRGGSKSSRFVPKQGLKERKHKCGNLTGPVLEESHQHLTAGKNAELRPSVDHTAQASATGGSL